MYKSLDVLNSGGGVVPNSVVYKYSDPLFHYIVIRSITPVGHALCLKVEVRLREAYFLLMFHFFS